MMQNKKKIAEYVVIIIIKTLCFLCNQITSELLISLLHRNYSNIYIYGLKSATKPADRPAIPKNCQPGTTDTLTKSR